jgi:hypothetical protein
MRFRRNSGLVLRLICAGALVGAAAPALEFTFSPADSTLTVSGVTPGGSVAVLGVSRIYRDGLAHLVRTPEVVSDEDGDGQVRIDAEIGPGSVWAAADLVAGTSLLASPGEGGVQDGAALAPTVEVQGSTSWRRLRAESKLLDVLVVRFGRGVWYASFCDGAMGDSDETRDGLIRIDRSAFRRLAGADETPGSLGATDLVVAIDPDLMRVVSRRIGQLPVEVTP